MARAFGKVYVDAWIDPDFQDLTPAEQRMFFLLLSQPMLNLAGLLPWQPKRWALASRHTSIRDVLTHCAALVDARLILVSLRTEELLIRSYTRRDVQLWNPLMVKGLARHITEIQSTSLRHALATELTRGREEAARQIADAKQVEKINADLDAIHTTLTRHRASDDLATGADLTAIADAIPVLVPDRVSDRLPDTTTDPVPDRTHTGSVRSQETSTVRSETSTSEEPSSNDDEFFSDAETGDGQSSSSQPSQPLDQLATDLEQALGSPVRFDITGSFTTIDAQRLSTAINKHGTQPYVTEARAASNGRGPADHAAAYLPRWRALTERLDKSHTKRPPANFCLAHHLEHRTAECPSCRSDRLAGDDTAPPQHREPRPMPDDLREAVREQLAPNDAARPADDGQPPEPEPQPVPAAPVWPDEPPF